MQRLYALPAVAVAVLLLAGASYCASIAEVKSGDWLQVTVEGVVTYLEPLECYIESPDRSGGIWVRGSTEGVGIGDSVLATGTFAVVDGEPAITAASILPHGMPSEIRPFGMRNSAIGGASKWSPLSIKDFRGAAWSPAFGANNTGVLVTTWGTVTGAYYSPINDTHWFYVDDGSGVVGDCGDKGVLVYSQAEAHRGDFVSVTGVSSTEPSLDDPGRLVRVLRTRQAADVGALGDGALAGRFEVFADEFNSPVLDRRWIVTQGKGSWSLQEKPGWLSITPSTQPGWPCWVWEFSQCPRGDWDLETKLQLLWIGGLNVYVNGVYVCLMDRTGPIDTQVSEFGLVGVTRDSSNYQYLARILDQYVPIPTGDTCWFRVRRRGATVSVQSSYDGVNYTQWTSTTRPEGGYLTVLPFGTGDQFRACIDYFRLSEVKE